MTVLESLVKISRYYGTNPAYVIAGGGNTSYKNAEKLHIKASGISLATIDTDGFVVMSRELLGKMEDKPYPDDVAQREEEVKQDLKKAIICPEHLRPSVETSLHNLIGYSYIVHTHPTTINALMCANDAKKEVEERFGSEALFVGYTDPGYILFKELRDMIREYQKSYKKDPQIIFLQNHGIFVGANSAREVKAIYDSIESRIRAHKDLSLPQGKRKIINRRFHRLWPITMLPETWSQKPLEISFQITSRPMVVNIRRSADLSPRISLFTANQTTFF